MIRSNRHSIRAFTLLEVVVILPALSAVFLAMIWAFNNHLKISRGMTRQTHRQERMHRILRTLREDMLSAESVALRAFNDDPAIPTHVTELSDLSPPADGKDRGLAAELTISRAGESIRYFVIRDDESIARSSISTLPDAPPEYHVVRIDPTDVISSRVWSLRDLLIRFEAAQDKNGDESRSALRIVFESAQQLDARVPMRRQFDTTLRVGADQ